MLTYYITFVIAKKHPYEDIEFIDSKEKNLRGHLLNQQLHLNQLILHYLLLLKSQCLFI